MRRASEHGVERSSLQHDLHRIEPCRACSGTTLARRGKRIEHMTAADGAISLRIPHDEAVAGKRAYRPFEHELHTPALTGGKRRTVEQRAMRDLMLRAQMHVQR